MLQTCGILTVSTNDCGREQFGTYDINSTDANASQISRRQGSPFVFIIHTSGMITALSDSLFEDPVTDSLINILHYNYYYTALITAQQQCAALLVVTYL